jgi:hypothetical protein
MMKKILSSTLLLSTLFVASASFAAGGPTGVGAIIGDPTGVSAKHWLTESTALDAAFAWTLDDSNAFGIHVDYLLHVPSMVRIGKADFDMHYGIGGVLVLADSSAFAFRAPVGLAYRFDSNPVDIFAEIAALLLVAPSTDFDINVGIGARYYF